MGNKLIVVFLVDIFVNDKIIFINILGNLLINDNVLVFFLI